MRTSTVNEMFRRRSLMIVGVAIVGVFTVAVFLGVAAVTNDQNEVPDWPSFTMTYEETGHFHGLAEPTSTRIYTVDYHSRSAWTKELISSTVDPREVGTTYRLNGGSFKITAPDTQEPILTDKAEVASPNWWLVPTRDLILESEKGFHIAESGEEGPNRVVYEKVEQLPCASAPAGEFDDVTQPSICHEQATYENRERIVYRTDVTPAVPIQITTTIAGELAADIRVTEFTLVDE